MKKISIVIILLLLLLIACATAIKSPEQTSQETKVSFDPYAGLYMVLGKKMNFGLSAFPNITEFYLQGGFDKFGKTEFYQLYVYHWCQTGWKFLHSASDITAIPLNVTILNRQVDFKATTTEEVAVDLPFDYLIKKKDIGLNIRILGDKGSITIEVPPAYIQGFLHKFNEAKRMYLNKESEITLDNKKG